MRNAKGGHTKRKAEINKLKNGKTVANVNIFKISLWNIQQNRHIDSWIISWQEIFTAVKIHWNDVQLCFYYKRNIKWKHT